MKKRLLTLVLTKTKLLRVLADAMAGALCSWGVVAQDQQSVIGGAVLAILSAIFTQLIEAKKDADAAKVQADYGLKPDGWIGPKSRGVLSGRTERVVFPRQRPHRRGNPKR